MSEMASESLLNFVGKYTKNDREVAVCQRRGYRMESWTYARIIGQANRVARELEVRGLGKGDAALSWGPNSAEWIVAFLGCVLRGVVIVPIDDGSALQFAERVARAVKAKFVFRANAHQEMDALPSLSFESLGEMTAKHDASFYPSPQLSRQDTLEVIFTSGTTAEPRGVVISHGNILANIERLELEIHKYLKYERLVHPLRFLNLLPLSHVFGQFMGMFVPLLLGGETYFLDSLNPSEIMQTVRKNRISVVASVPRVLDTLRNKVERDYEAR